MKPPCLNDFKKGATVTDKAFASASRDKEFALQYVDSKEKKYPIFQIIQSKTGRAIKEAVPGGAMGDEVLFKRGTVFKVTQSPTEDTLNGVYCYVVKLEEV